MKRLVLIIVMAALIVPLSVFARDARDRPFLQVQSQQSKKGQGDAQRGGQDFRRQDGRQQRDERQQGGRMTDEERRDLHRDLDRANREIYRQKGKGR